MITPICVSDVILKEASAGSVASGLVGYITLTIDDVLILDGITLRRSSDGRPYLAYPRRVDRRGVHHSQVRPIGDGVRREIERQVLDALGYRRDVAP